MIDPYANAERMAICLESGVPYAIAKQIADAEQPKPESEAVRRAKEMQERVRADKFKSVSKRGIE